LIDLVELEVRDLLAHYGYPDDVPVIRGSARAAHDAPGDPVAARCIHELLAALDSYVLEPQRDADQPLLLSVENVFSIEGRGTVASGKVERGRVRSGDEVEIVGLGREPRRCVVVSVEEFNAPLSVAEAGQNVGLLLRGVRRDEVERGHLVAAPRTLVPRTRFEAEVYVLTKEEGGRHTPFVSGYAPHFFFRTSDVTGTTELLGENSLCMPGDNAQVSIALQHSLAVNVGDRFTFREGGRTVGSGIVTRIVA
jgi:elongation factor Tu